MKRKRKEQEYKYDNGMKELGKAASNGNNIVGLIRIN